MSYQVLATKWRPKNFKDIVGQEHVVRAIMNSFNKNMLHNAYLFTGTRGVGKTTIARILAKSFNCENLINSEPCNRCSSCLQIDKGNFVDLFELDAASNTGIDNMREILDNSLYLPTVGKYKVYIIDEVHMLSKSAFNAMLKTLEEPPAHTKFILATTECNKIPITVLSRCLQFVLYNLTLDQIGSRLEHILKQEQIQFEFEAVQLISRFAKGSVRDALSLLDQAIALGNGEVIHNNVRQMLGLIDRSYIFNLLLSIHYTKKDDIFKLLKEISLKTISFRVVLEELSIILQEIALFQINHKAVEIDNPDYSKIEELSKILQAEEIQIYYQCCLQGKKDLGLNPDDYSGFIMSILRMLAFTPICFKDNDEKSIFIQENKKKSEVKLDHNKFNQDLSCDVNIYHKAIDGNLPNICQDNWHEVIYKMKNYLGPTNVYVKYSALVSIDKDSIYLAISEQGEKYAKDNVKKLKEIFMQYYSVNIKFVPWNTNYITVNDVNNKNLDIKKQMALNVLNNDKMITKIKEDLNLDWDLNSIRLTNI